MEKPKASIVIVSYNEADYIQKALDSCLAQKTCFPFEIIIGDDGSTDDSKAIIESYVAAHPGTISSFYQDRSDIGPEGVVPSIRVSNIIKRGCAQAKGDYICVMSADDWYCDEHKLATQVDFLEKHPSFASCHTDFLKKWPDGREEAWKQPASRGRAAFWSGAYVHIACFVFRRAVADDMLARICDDTGLLFSILCAGPTRLIKRSSFVHRQREGSIIHSIDKTALSLTVGLLYQDVLDHGGFKLSSLARYYPWCRHLYSQRHELSEARYQRFFSAARPGELIWRIRECQSLPARTYMLARLALMALVHLAFKPIRRIDRLIHQAFSL